MKLHQLRTLIAVHEYGSLQEASKQLHVTQPALSRAMQELEQVLGVPLLIRSSRGASLTDYGLRLLSHARHVQESLQRARSDIDDLKGEASHQVTFALTAAASTLAPVTAAVRAFQSAYPQVNLRIHEYRPVQIVNQLREGVLDFGLLSQAPMHVPALEWLPICRLAMQVVANRDHPLRAARSLQQLLDQSWHTSDAPDNPSSVFVQLFLQNGLPVPTRVLECSSLLLSMGLLFQSPILSLAAGNAFADSDSPFASRMVAVPLQEPVPDSHISMVCISRQLLTRPAAALFSLIHEHLLAEYPPA